MIIIHKVYAVVLWTFKFESKVHVDTQIYFDLSPDPKRPMLIEI